MNKKKYLLILGILTTSLLLKISSLVVLYTIHVHAEEAHPHEEIAQIVVPGKREMKRKMPL